MKYSIRAHGMGYRLMRYDEPASRSDPSNAEIEFWFRIQELEEENAAFRKQQKKKKKKKKKRAEKESQEVLSLLTVTINIGNSDNRLSQQEWSEYVNEVHTIVEVMSSEVHFAGGSDCVASRQNACFVATVRADKYPKLEQWITGIRGKFRQEAAAITTGQVRFI